MISKTVLVALFLAAAALPAAAHDEGPWFGTAPGGLTGAERTQLAEDRFAAADADGDGQLTQDELFAAAEAAEKLRREERIAQMMEAIDSDGDGTLTLEEMQADPGEMPGNPGMHRFRGGRPQH